MGLAIFDGIISGDISIYVLSSVQKILGILKMLIPVTYMCWGCGNTLEVMEESADNIPSKEIWNVCSDCQLKEDNDVRQMG